METLPTLTCREQIELLKEESDFEERGDAFFLDHPDDETRLLWAFHRPSGSHPSQVSDPNAEVAIMAFNHSRLGAYERFTRLNPEVIADPDLRRHIRNRSRMLFRAMVDDDFSELLEVLTLFPVFIDLSCDQMINGRIWNERYASPLNASRFLEMADGHVTDALADGVVRRLKPLREQSFDEVKSLIGELTSQAQKLHSLIKAHYVRELEQWIRFERLHPLQMIVVAKQIDILKERP